MTFPIDLAVALHQAGDDPSDENVAAILRLVPEHLLLSEHGRRRGAKTIHRSGPTGYWSRHNPNVHNCRCRKCHERKLRKGTTR